MKSRKKLKTRQMAWFLLALVFAGCKPTTSKPPEPTCQTPLLASYSEYCVKLAYEFGVRDGIRLIVKMQNGTATTNELEEARCKFHSQIGKGFLR